MVDIVSVEEARNLVLGVVNKLSTETVDLLDAVGRVAASPLKSDMDVFPFDHAAMDGFALKADQIKDATEEQAVVLEVVGEVAAGDVFSGDFGEHECVRIMTGAPVPAGADSVVKYEIVPVVSGDGKAGSRVSFAAPTKVGSNIRKRGEEARAGETIMESGEVIGEAGAGFLAACGITRVEVYRRPRVAVIAIGDELVPIDVKPSPGKIRNSNSYALAACIRRVGALPSLLPIVPDDFQALKRTLQEAAQDYDFILTSGGASNGDFDFIKPALRELGDLLMTKVNMRPGKAQTLGIVGKTPVFGLAGNPAAAYCGFELLVRPALRKMQGYGRLEIPRVMARLTQAVAKRDPRRLYLRATLERHSDGSYEVTPAQNQSSGLFGVIQKTNCLAVVKEGLESLSVGDELCCLLPEVSEDAGI